MNHLEVGSKKQQIKRQYRYAFKQTAGVCLQNTTDYSPFGVALDGRTIESDFYRRGFNGMEKDDEVKGGGNSYTTKFRQNDPRVGRWLSLDPKMSAWESPYVSMGNNTVLHNDIIGDTVRLASSLNDDQKVFYGRIILDLRTYSSVFNQLYEELDRSPKTITIHFNDQILGGEGSGKGGGATPSGNVYFKNGYSDDFAYKTFNEEFFHSYQFILYGINTSEELKTGSKGRKIVDLESEAKFFNFISLTEFNLSRNPELGFSYVMKPYEEGIAASESLENIPRSENRQITGEKLLNEYDKYIRTFEENAKGSLYEGKQSHTSPDAYNEIIKKTDNK